MGDDQHTEPTDETTEDENTEDEVEVEGFATYIRFDGIDGESKDSSHGGWSDLLSFSQPIHQPGLVPKLRP